MSDIDGFAIVPPEKGDGFVELSRSTQGRVFRKQILHYGDLMYPGVKGGKVKVDEAFADKLIANFTNKVADIVQVPKAGANNEHTEDPDRNIGEVIAVRKGAKGVYVDMDIRTDDADKIGKTLLGSSAMLHLNYTDTKTGEKVGPTLLHNCITNRPYVTDLEDFEEVLQMSAPGVDITDQKIVVLTSAPDGTKEKHMSTLDELFAELKSDHGIDVPALQAKAADADKAVALSNKIQEELVGTGLLKLSAGQEVDSDTLISAVAEAGSQIVELTNKVDGLVEDAAKKDAAAAVEKLVLTGYILPKDKDAMLELRLSNVELFDKLVPEKPVIKLSHEDGFEPHEDTHSETVESEIARLSNVASEQTKAFVRA